MYALKIRDAQALNETNQLLVELKSQSEQRSYIQQVIDLLPRAAQVEIQQQRSNDSMEMFASADEEYYAIVEVEGWRRMLRRLRKEFEGEEKS